MMERRRLLLMDDKYIQDGLVFWLDGIRKGNDNTQWKSLIGDYTFALTDCVFADKSVQFNGSTSYGECPQNTTIATPLNGTIEVVFNLITMANTYQTIFTGGAFNNRDQIGAYINETAGYTVYDLRNVNYRTMWGTGTLSGTRSVNRNIACSNGRQVITTYSYNSFAPSSNDTFAVGRRFQNNAMWFKGDIYAIRIYNRQLTLDEMIYNQKIDNRRFNLGLNI